MTTESQIVKHYLSRSAELHRHLCPRQVLGVRMALCAGRLLELDLPQRDKRLLVIAETDGCAVDGISVVTGCTVGHRTLRVEDYGKIAATFVDTSERHSIRIVPARSIRTRSCQYAPEQRSTWETHLIGYQRMPDAELLEVQRVELVVPIDKIVSRAGRKAMCDRCGEEINNERETLTNGHTLCQSCAVGGYYRVLTVTAYDDVPSTEAIGASAT